MGENNLSDRFIGLQVRVKEVEKDIRDEGMNTHYDLTNTIYQVMDNAISTCHTILSQTKNTILDCKEAIKTQPKPEGPPNRTI